MEVKKKDIIQILKYVQVIFIEIGAFFRQLSQNMITDCLPDFATFNTNLHILTIAEQYIRCQAKKAYMKKNLTLIS